jgi:hypothetical protein
MEQCGTQWISQFFNQNGADPFFVLDEKMLNNRSLLVHLAVTHSTFTVIQPIFSANIQHKVLKNHFRNYFEP